MVRSLASKHSRSYKHYLCRFNLFTKQLFHVPSVVGTAFPFGAGELPIGSLGGSADTSSVFSVFLATASKAACSRIDLNSSRIF